MALAASGNFSRAAEDRHMTQPAFSRRIRALEQWLGVELIDRSVQPVRLTETGEWLQDTARDLLARVDRLPVEAQAIAESHSAVLRFAATHALSFTFMPGWLRRLESRIAIGPVRLMSDVLQRCEAMLYHGQVQFVLSHAHPDYGCELTTRDYPSIRVGSDRLLPVSAVDAEGLPRYRLDNSTDSASLLDYSPESGLGRILSQVREPMKTPPVFTAHLASVLRTMTLDGRGIAWLPQTLITDDLKAGRLVEAGDDSIELEIRLYRHRDRLGAAGEVFWSTVGKTR